MPEYPARRIPMSEPGPTENTVQGERDATSVNRAPSVQSRISSVLAIGLMSVLGLGMLTWYYANAITRQSRARQSAQTLSTNPAQGDSPLPSLRRIDPPRPPPSAFDTAPLPPPHPAPPSTPANPLILPHIP